ncbi:MAG: hypothetical protein LBU62_01090, partial [Bacteroidales bacterium]|nr:hypothetical protein [Bacteroidales bacterium]
MDTAQDRITFVRGSKEEFRAYQMREMAMSDLTSGLNFAKREGIAIGEANVARNMKAAGMSAQQICIFTG